MQAQCWTYLISDKAKIVPVLLTKRQRPKGVGLTSGNGTIWSSKKLVREGAIGDRYCVCVIVFMNEIVGPGDGQRAGNRVPLLALVCRVSKDHGNLKGQNKL